MNPSEGRAWDRTAWLLRDKRRGPGTVPSYRLPDEIVDRGTVLGERVRVLVLAIHVTSESLPTFLIERGHHVLPQLRSPWDSRAYDACVVLTTRDGRPSIELVPTWALLSGYFTF